MATKKDLVEAYSFSRRRLVTAFLSGAPGGREVEPARPGRTVVGGLALAVLLVAGAAIASVLASRTDEDWNKVGLVVSQQTSAQYVILKEAEHPLLIPVANVTSAQLILGADVKPTYVDQSVIADQTPGDLIGIFGAPQLLPQPFQFIEQGWTSCTDQGLGMSLDISRSERTTAQPDRGAVVSTTDSATGRSSYYVIAQSSSREGQDRRTYAYPVQSKGQAKGLSDQVLGDLGLDDTADAVTVPEAWVRLFPIGGGLDADSFPIPDWGQPPPASVARFLPAGTTIGQYYDHGADSFVVTSEGRVPLDPFALAVYRQTRWKVGKQRLLPQALTGAPSPGLRGGTALLGDAHWPDSRLKPVNGQLCAQLDVHADEVPKVSLRSDPTGAAAASENSSTGDAPAFSIDRGQGAYVMVGDWDDETSTSRVVVDPRGIVYTLIGDDTVGKLGYDAVKPPLVPDPWIKLMQAGVALSTNAALCPPVVTAPAPADAGATASSASASASPGTTGPTAGAAPRCQAPPS